MSIDENVANHGLQLPESLSVMGHSVNPYYLNQKVATGLAFANRRYFAHYS